MIAYLIIIGLGASISLKVIYDCDFKYARYVEFYEEGKIVGIMRECWGGYITHRFGNTSFDDYLKNKTTARVHRDHLRYLKLKKRFGDAQ